MLTSRAGAQILIDASNGASDYGNKFGEPLLGGYTRAFGLRLPSGQRREWIKPIMFRRAQCYHNSGRRAGPCSVARCLSAFAPHA